MPEILSTVYDPVEIERIADAIWTNGNYFHAEPPAKGGKDAPAYTIVIPPPNITGALHMGHAIDNTLQDILIRLKRMQGFNTLWLPGTDHAGIATQSVVEKRLRTEHGKTRHDVGREKLLEMIWQWKDQYGNRILEQLKRIGASCDWQRTRFTLDDMCAKAVRHTFVKLFKKGLIYRGKRLVNWDPILQTAVSDDEVVHKTVQGSFWYIKYPLTDGSGHITIATTRPETMLGDTAVAVNPKEEKAAHLIGKFVKLPLTDREIPIIADAHVKRGEGTGFLKVTPAHDPNDYEIGLRHNLPMLNIMTDDAKINENGGKYEGLDRFKARKQIVADLEAQGLLEKVEPREHEVGHSDRSGDIIEPYLSDQWFVKVEPLAKRAIEVVEDDKIKFHPQRYRKSYLDWLGGIRDWCISRQLWWGHRIPVWHLHWEGPKAFGATDSQIVRLNLPFLSPEENQHIITQVVREREDGRIFLAVCVDEGCPNIEKKLEAHGAEHDPDVLDTWFSSALWPHSTLGWPEETDELKCYYPTSTLVTARDIITLWVSRMVMMGLENMDEVPFADVFIHGTILDGKGERMSKSKGNGIDPIDIINTYGADAMRFSMAQMTTESQDIKLPVTKDKDGRNVSEKFDIGRNFCNKLWNASRFTMMNLEGMDSGAFDVEKLDITDKWILSRLADTVADVTELLENFKFSEPLMVLYRFFWNDFCDWYLEWAKARMADDTQKPIAQNVLAFVLDAILRMLHPFIPFITEGIFQKLNEIAPNRGLKDLAQLTASDAIIVAEWPKRMDILESPDVEEKISIIQEVVRTIREVRNKYAIPPNKKLAASANCPADIAKILSDNANLVTQMAGLTEFTCSPDAQKPENASATIADQMQVFVHDIIDKDAELKRLEKQKNEILGFIKSSEGKLSNENFVSRAKPEVVAAARDKLAELKEQLAAVEKNIADLN
ncbi:MAG: valine--tRNA ligase [Anaerohalosphaeraceae bacterium]|nr:valine--tRNA ligase [Anaerohalosphaeraceae bacterium]